MPITVRIEGSSTAYPFRSQTYRDGMTVLMTESAIVTAIEFGCNNREDIEKYLWDRGLSCNLYRYLSRMHRNGTLDVKTVRGVPRKERYQWSVVKHE